MCLIREHLQVLKLSTFQWGGVLTFFLKKNYHLRKRHNDNNKIIKSIVFDKNKYMTVCACARVCCMYVRKGGGGGKHHTQYIYLI